MEKKNEMELRDAQGKNKKINLEERSSHEKGMSWNEGTRKEIEPPSEHQRREANHFNRLEKTSGQIT